MTHEERVEYLRRTEFFTALKAIAIYQNFHSLEHYATLIESVKLPLPVFNKNNSSSEQSKEKSKSKFKTTVKCF